MAQIRIKATQQLFEQQYAINVEKLIMNLILDNNYDELKQKKYHQQNLNFFEDFKIVPIDIKMSPLLLASYLGRQEIVKLFLTNENLEVDICSPDSTLTPLCAACMSGQYEIARMLIEHGANPNIKQETNKINVGPNPLWYCFSRLEEQNNYFENRRICIKLAQLLLENGADIDAVVNEKKGFSILMVFCGIKITMSKRENDVNQGVIKFLLECGASKSLLSKKGKSIEQIAEKHQNKENVLKLLNDTKQIYYYSTNSNIRNDTTTLKQHIIGQIHNKRKMQIVDCKLEDAPKTQNQYCSLFSWFTK